MKNYLNTVSDDHYIRTLEKKHSNFKKVEVANHSKSKETYWLRRIIKVMVRNTSVLSFLLAFSFYSSAQTKEPLEIKKAYIQSFNEGSAIKLSQYFGSQMPKSKSRNLNKSLERALQLVGKVVSMTLVNTSDNSFSYKVLHEKMSTLEVVFELDKNGQLAAMTLGPYVYKNAPKLDRNSTELILPFNGEWYTFWGGKTTSENYHNSSSMMRGAYDFFVIGTNGQSHNAGATKNEDFYAFGKDIIAPAEGKIVFASDDIKDNKWPSMNREAAYGNVVMLETSNGEYMVFAHLKLNSVNVKKGQLVKQGDVLGQCGNSGNSTEPHLHFQIQNIPDFSSPTGAWIYFERIKVNGQIKDDYLPVRRDKVSNLGN